MCVCVRACVSLIQPLAASQSGLLIVVQQLNASIIALLHPAHLPFQPHTGICFDFLRTTGCHRGLMCRFSHDLSSIEQQCAHPQGNLSGSGERSSNDSGECSRAFLPAAAGGGQKGQKAICFDFVKGE